MGALRRSTKGQLCVLDDLLGAQARRLRPAGSQAAHPSPVPTPLSASSPGDALPYTVELHRFVLDLTT